MDLITLFEKPYAFSPYNKMMKSWKKYLFFDFELFEIFIKKIIIIT